MSAKKASGAIPLALALLCLAAGGLPAGQTGPVNAGQIPAPAAVQSLLHPRPSGPIVDRAAWAYGEAKANRWEKGFWLGFGIRRLMGEHSSMGWHPWGGPESHLTLDDLINGRKTALEKKVDNDQAARGAASSMPGEVRSFAAGRSGDHAERPVMKDVGILLRMNSGEAGFPADIRISNLDVPFDLEERPLVWVGMATDAESLAYLVPLYSRAVRETDKRSLLWAIGLHRDAAVVVPFVAGILAGKEGEEIRAEAAACLGEQNDPKALDLLLKTIKVDPSGEVRKHAVEGLVEMELPAATDALTALAMNGADRLIRADAVRGLADKANATTVGALERISAGDKDPEIQKEAIHALADLPARSGLPYLVSLVKTHPDAEVRKEAVAAIGDVGGPEAVRLLTDWARGKRR